MEGCFFSFSCLQESENQLPLLESVFLGNEVVAGSSPTEHFPSLCLFPWLSCKWEEGL